MSCHYCEKETVYKCNICGKLLCIEHTKLTTTCPNCTRKATLRYTINKADINKDKNQIRQFVKRFWGEQEQLTFNKKYTVTELPAYTAKTKNRTIGFISYAENKNSTIIVALGILPKHQNCGIGKNLVKKVQQQAKRQKKKKILVSTSNDDLPALAFYQNLGFQIYQVKPNAIAEKHGKIQKGIAGLPVRDEIRLQKTIH